MKFSLQGQILSALSLFALIFIGALALNSYHFKIGLENQKNLALTKALSIRSSDLANRATTYGKVAPREFAAYERDLILFYPNLKNELDELDKSVKDLDQINSQKDRTTTRMGCSIPFRTSSIT